MVEEIDLKVSNVCLECMKAYEMDIFGITFNYCPFCGSELKDLSKLIKQIKKEDIM